MPKTTPKSRPKPGQGRLKLSEMRARRAEALGGRYVELEDDDGNVLVQIPRMAFWDAATYEDVLLSPGATGDMATLERIMEPEDFTKLKELNLELGDMRDLLAEVMRDAEDPESQGSSPQ